MKKNLLEILCCPFCKGDLKLQKEKHKKENIYQNWSVNNQIISTAYCYPPDNYCKLMM